MAKKTGWTSASSPRKAGLPADWPSRRVRVLQRDRFICRRCGAAATDVDHIDGGDDHSLGNLQALCHSCHMKKTGAAGGTAPRRRRRLHREPGRHPGLLPPESGL